MNEAAIVDFPKLKSPFIRKNNERGDFIVTPEIEPGYEWIFDSEVRAVDKLHGTNICIHILSGEIVAIDNRVTRIINSPTLKTNGDGKYSIFLEGLVNSINRQWLHQKSDGAYYGELIGEKINGNLHKINQHLFVPFDYLQKKCHWHSWVQNKYPKNFESLSDWFKDLTSLFSKQIMGIETPAEGLVFTHPDGRMAKLRRDMFDWFEGRRHGRRVE